MAEKDLQKDCNKTLSDLGIKYFHREKGRTHRSTNHSKGLPDLMIFFKSGLVFVELKTLKGVLSDDQKQWMSDLPKNYPYYVCRDLDDFHNIVKKYK